MKGQINIRKLEGMAFEGKQLYEVNGQTLTDSQIKRIYDFSIEEEEAKLELYLSGAWKE